MKKHTTVTITKKMLMKLGACASGLEEVAHFLPAKISTDPEKNIALACKLAKEHGADDEHTDRPFWLVFRASAERLTDVFPDGSLLVGDSYATQYDAFIIMQWLAWVADALATKAGR